MNEHLKEKINTLKDEIDALRPLDKDTEGRIQQKFRLDWNYHSNNIEGNSLTFGETKTFLLHGITADGKPLKDHLDIKGHNSALEMLEDVVKDERDLNETFIRELHQIILNEPYEKPAITPEGKKTTRTINVGSYKTQPNHVVTKTGETFYFAKPEETPAMMHDLMDWFNASIKERKLHPLELAALLHYKFIRIHPFDDGNGRLARILMNLTLMKFGFTPVIIKTQKKHEYYRALQQADGGDTLFFLDYIAQLQIDSLELYLRGAKGEHIEDEDDIGKEIALFKLSFKNDSLLNTYRSIANQNKRLIDSYIPLIQKMITKIILFDELFSYYNHSIYTTGDSILYLNNNKDIESFLKKEFERTSFSIFTLQFYWKNLKVSAKAEESISYNLYIQFTKTHYQIGIDGSSDLIIKDYSQVVNYDEMQKFILVSANHIMKKIEEIK